MMLDNLHLIDDLMPEEMREQMKTRGKDRQKNAHDCPVCNRCWFTPRKPPRVGAASASRDDEGDARKIVASVVQSLTLSVSLMLESWVVIVLAIYESPSVRRFPKHRYATEQQIRNERWKQSKDLKVRAKERREEWEN